MQETRVQYWQRLFEEVLTMDYSIEEFWHNRERTPAHFDPSEVEFV